MDKMTARNEHIDVMKGFAIILVILGHRFMSNTIDGAHHPMAIIIYSFHMAFFFFISGYVNEYTRQLVRKGAKRFMLNKVRTLMLPFFIWTLICYLSNGSFSVEGFVSSLNFYPEKGYWFLPILFAFFAVYLLLCSMKSKLVGGGYYCHFSRSC